MIIMLIDNLFELQREDAINLYEIYVEHIRFTKQMKAFYQLKNHFSMFNPPEPKFFSLNTENNKNIELHINELKKNLTVSAPVEKISSNGIIIRIKPSLKSIKSTTNNFNKIQNEESLSLIRAETSPKLKSSINQNIWKVHAFTNNDQESINFEGNNNSLISEFDIPKANIHGI